MALFFSGKAYLFWVKLKYLFYLYSSDNSIESALTYIVYDNFCQINLLME